jgi:hypothetical protein
MQFQNINSIDPKLDSLLSSNPNRSLSGIFKALRKEKRINLLGNYPLLSYIISYGYSRSPQYVWNRNQILRAVRISGFYKEEEKRHAYIPKEWERYIKQ